MDERVLILWPGNRAWDGQLPWIGAAAEEGLPGAIKAVMENQQAGTVDMADDWWPIELSPIPIPDTSARYCGCRPMLCGNNVIAVLLLWNEQYVWSEQYE